MSFCKIAVLKHFEIFTREHRCRGLFFNKAASFRPAPLFKRVSNTFVSSEFCKNFRNNFFMKLLTRTAKLERFCAFLSKLCSNQPICCQLSYKRLFIWRWAGPVRWAGSPRWDSFYPTFKWNLLSQLKQKVCYVTGKRLFDQPVFTIKWRKAIMQNECSYII